MAYYDNLPSFKPVVDPQSFSGGRMSPEDRATMNMRMDAAVPDAVPPQRGMPMLRFSSSSIPQPGIPTRAPAITPNFPVNLTDRLPTLGAPPADATYVKPPIMQPESNVSAGQQAVGDISGKTIVPYMADALNSYGAGNYPRAAGAAAGAIKSAVVNVPTEVGKAVYGGLRSGMNEFIAGARGVPSTPVAPITVDKAGNFSRAPQNPDEYKKAMELKYGAGGGSASYNNLSKMGSADANDIKQAYERLNARRSGGVAGNASQPAMSYDDWVMKQPVSKLDADGYARRAQLEIEKRRPETTQQNIMMATNYALSHPDMVTGETHHRDGSWSKTYGDRAHEAMAGYGSFKQALASEAYHNALGQAAQTRADNSEKFTPADKVGMVGQVQNQMMQALLGDNSIPSAQRIRAARAYWPSFMSALKQNGVDPSTMDFDSFIQEQTGAIADPAYPGTYKVPK